MIEQDPEYTREDLQKLGAKWMERIGAAKTREEDWIKDAEKAETAYLCGAGQKDVRLSDVPDFNILHSNVETIVPAIYNSTAIPEIRPRFDQGDGVDLGHFHRRHPRPTGRGGPGYSRGARSGRFVLVPPGSTRSHTDACQCHHRIFLFVGHSNSLK